MEQAPLSSGLNRVLLAPFWNPEERQLRAFWSALLFLNFSGSLQFLARLVAEAAKLPAPSLPQRELLGLALSAVVALVALSPAAWRVLLVPFWNPQEQRLRALWRLLVWFNLAGLLFQLVRTAGVAQGAFFQSSLLRLVVLTLAVMLATWLVDRRGLAALGLRVDRIWLADLGFGLGLGAVLISVVFGVEWLAGWIVILRRFTTDAPSFALGVAQGLITFLCVGFYEELVSRAYLLRNIADGLHWRRINSQLALLFGCGLSSLMFGMGHANNPGSSVVSIVNIALAGVLLSLPYLLTGRLAISIGMHITWNLFQAMLGLPVSGLTFKTSFLAVQQGGPSLWTGGAFGIEGGLLGIIAMVSGGALIHLWVGTCYGGPALHTALIEHPRRA